MDCNINQFGKTALKKTDWLRTENQPIKLTENHIHHLKHFLIQKLLYNIDSMSFSLTGLNMISLRT